jgi:glucan phosphoethanolaminetransferase (alkaline phosphatase superfamily)
MSGIGKSIRERADMSYAAHCWGVVTDLCHIGNWLEWSAFKDVLVAILQLVLMLMIIILLPLSVPLLGWVRQRWARDRFRKEAAYFEGVKRRMQSRVQKEDQS